MSETYIVDLPISPAAADVAGAPAGMIEHYVRYVGRPQGQGTFISNTIMTDPIHSEIPDAAVEAAQQAAYEARPFRGIDNNQAVPWSAYKASNPGIVAKETPQMRAALAAALSHLSPPAYADRAGVVERLTRPIIGIENRTAQEAFDIMADRFRSAISQTVGK